MKNLPGCLYVPSPPVEKPLTKPRNTNSFKHLQHPWQVGENIPISETGKPRHRIKSFSEELRILSLTGVRLRASTSALDRWETRGCLNSESGPRRSDHLPHVSLAGSPSPQDYLHPPESSPSFLTPREDSFMKQSGSRILSRE